MNRPIWPWIILALCVAFFGVRQFAGGPSARKVRLSYVQAAGYGIGQLLARDFPGGGKVLYLVPGAAPEAIDAQFRPQVDGLRAGYGGKGLDVEIVVGEGDQAPRRALRELQGIEVRPLDGVAAVVRSHPEAVALVSMGPPSILPTPALLATLPPLYILDQSADPAWPDLLRRRVVKGVVTRNPEADLLPMPEGYQDAAEVFALRYKLVAP